MSDASKVVERARSAAKDLEQVLMKDGVTGDVVKSAAAPFDEIEAELEKLLKDG